MPYFTAIRGYTAKRIEEIRNADILVGIPCYNNEKTIAHVIQMVSHGLDTALPGLRNVIMVADGGSTDDTREAAKEFQIKPWQEKIVSIYRGPAGKGTALRSVFEAARIAPRPGLRRRRRRPAEHHLRLDPRSPRARHRPGLPVRRPGLSPPQVRRNDHQQHRLQPDPRPLRQADPPADRRRLRLLPGGRQVLSPSRMSGRPTSPASASTSG